MNKEKINLVKVFFGEDCSSMFPDTVIQKAWDLTEIFHIIGAVELLKTSVGGSMEFPEMENISKYINTIKENIRKVEWLAKIDCFSCKSKNLDFEEDEIKVKCKCKDCGYRFNVSKT